MPARSETRTTAANASEFRGADGALQPVFRLGVDVGETNTDAVIVDAAGTLIAQVKSPTTTDVTKGIQAAIAQLLATNPVPRREIKAVMLGTTHAAKAVLERRDLRRVAVIRIGGPATRAFPPLALWPDELRTAVSGGEIIIDGCIGIDGEELMPLDTGAIARFLESLEGQVSAVAVTSVYASVSEAQELAAARIANDVLHGIHVSMSHEIGTFGLLERENATVLNAALIGCFAGVASALEATLRAHDLAAGIYLAQSDGTLMALDYGLTHPALTIASGRANGVCGAARLTGLDDALVVDVGNAAIHVGMLTKGLPLEATGAHRIGGVMTNFRVPAFVDLEVGAGSIISGHGAGVVVGPQSVGSRLSQEALVFGGSTPTVIDAAVAAGRAVIGKPQRTRPHRRMLSTALSKIDGRIGSAAAAMKLSSESLPMIVVGGGAFIVPDAFDGVSQVLRPVSHEVANAIGAATASVGGNIDRLVDLARGDADAAVEAAREAAVARAICAGADPQRTRTVVEELVPLAYLTNPAARIRVEVTGPPASLG